MLNWSAASRVVCVPGGHVGFSRAAGCVAGALLCSWKSVCLRGRVINNNVLLLSGTVEEV